jgi:hypothetical protein
MITARPARTPSGATCRAGSVPGPRCLAPLRQCLPAWSRPDRQVHVAEAVCLRGPGGGTDRCRGGRPHGQPHTAPSSSGLPRRVQVLRCVSSIGVIVGPEPASAPEEIADGGAERGGAGAVRAAYQGLPTLSSPATRRQSPRSRRPGLTARADQPHDQRILCN